MATYETEYSQFPQELIALHNFKNVDNTIAETINNINTLRSQGDYAEAASLIESNKKLLSQYIIDATTFRTWEEEIYNAQKYAKQAQQKIFFDDKEPEYCIEEDVWLGV